MIGLDEKLVSWAEDLGAHGKAKGSRTAELIKEAIQREPRFQNASVRVVGSYANNTNTHVDSDVDVAVVLPNVFFYELPTTGTPPTREMLDFKDSDYRFEQYRREIGAALVKAFGEGVTFGNKAFNLRKSARRLEADVAPFFPYRRYTGGKDAKGEWAYEEGVAMCSLAEPSQRIINWHEQHRAQGDAKNEATKRQFKRVVRVLKNLRAAMSKADDPRQKSAAGQVTSFFLECLAFNAPDDRYHREDGHIRPDVESVLDWLIQATRYGADASGFVEVNRMKKLFGPPHGRMQEQAYAFLHEGRAFLFGRGAK